MKNFTKTYSLIALSLIFCVPAKGQVDLRRGQYDQTTLRMGLYAHGERENQDWVREFDGRPFELGIEKLDSYGYNGGLSWWLETRDLVVQDESVDLDLGLTNRVGLRIGTDRLTHRLAVIPAVNPFLAGTVAAGGDIFIDLIPGSHHEMRRRVNFATLRLTPWNERKVRLVGDWWEETESGSRQVLFRSRSSAMGVPLPPGIVSSTRYGGGVLLDRKTTEGSFGTDLNMGRTTDLTYRFIRTRFEDQAGDPLTGSFSPFPAINQIIQPNIKMDSHSVKARSRIGDRLYFTGSHVNRNRDNNTSTLTGSGPVDRVNSIDVNATSLAMAFLATDALTLTGRYRRYDLDNNVEPVGAAPTPQNQAVSREENSISLEASYSGIRRAFLRASYEMLEIDRTANPFHPDHEEFEHPFTSLSTKSNIWRLGARCYPTSKLSMSANWDRSFIDAPEFSGTPTDRNNLNLEATYLFSDSFALYGNFSRWREDNDQIRVATVPTATATIVDDPLTPENELTEYLEARMAAAGQGYKNDQDTTTLGAWYALSSKLTLDMNYAKSTTDAGALWVIGDDASAANRFPHLLPRFTPYDAKDEMWSAGLAYAFHPKWRVYSRFMNSNSQGHALINATTGGGVDLGVGPVWTPIDVNQRRYTIGLGYNVSPVEELLVDVSISRWRDRIDNNQAGRFSMVRFAWSHKY